MYIASKNMNNNKHKCEFDPPTCEKLNLCMLWVIPLSAVRMF